MPYEIEYLEDLNIVQIVTIGEMYYPDYERQAEEAVKISAQNNTGLFFADITRLINRAGVGDVLRMNQLYEDLAQPKSNRMALLTSADHPDYNVAKIFELSCTVRGWNVRCFIDKKSAIRWLTA